MVLVYRVWNEEYGDLSWNAEIMQLASMGSMSVDEKCTSAWHSRFECEGFVSDSFQCALGSIQYSQFVRDMITESYLYCKTVAAGSHLAMLIDCFNQSQNTKLELSLLKLKLNKVETKLTKERNAVLQTLPNEKG